MKQVRSGSIFLLTGQELSAFGDHEADVAVPGLVGVTVWGEEIQQGGICGVFIRAGDDGDLRGDGF